MKKFSKRIGAFIEDIAVPLARLKAKDVVLGRLARAKTKEEHDEIMASLEKEIAALKSGETGDLRSDEEDKATEIAIEGFLAQMTTESRADYRTAFVLPLKERYPRAKNSADKVAFRYRRHVFVAASVFSVFSIFVELLSK